MKQLINPYSFKNLIAGSLLLLTSVTGAYAAPNESANLVIYRAEDNSALLYRYSVDGKHLGKLKHGEQFALQLAAGEHTISISDPKKTKLTVKVQPHHVTFVRSTVDRKSRLSLKQEATTQVNASL